MRSNFCKAVVREATALAKKKPDLIGFVLMGDANCTHAQWSSAVWEADHKLWQRGACVQKGVNKKDGDISIAMGSNLTFYENICKIKEPEAQPDPMYFHCMWKGWTLEQRVLQSSFSNQVNIHISKRPRLMNYPIQQQAVSYEDPWESDNERGAAEHV